MDNRERLDDSETGIKTALHGAQSQIWTALPGIVQSFNATAMTCVVQPSVQGVQTKQDGSTAPVTMPKLLDCPVVFQSAGGVTLTLPIKAGDECLVVFSSRCIDAWWQQGGVQPPMEARMHDLSDGFVFVGPRSQPNVIGSISTTAAQLRSDDGSTFVELDPEAQTVNITAPGGSTITADVTIDGTLHVTQQITCDADVVASGISLKNHTHSDPQGGETGGPTG